MEDIDWKAEEAWAASVLQRVKFLKGAVAQEKQRLAEAELELKHRREAQEVLQRLAQSVQQQAHKRIAGVVSTCLSTVFDEPYDFQILFERKRGRTEARLRFVRKGVAMDPMTASGGGAVDVASFALRVAALTLKRPRLSRLLVLDEPFKNLSAEYQDNIRMMLEGLARDLDLQVVMVTHNPRYATGRVIEVGR